MHRKSLNLINSKLKRQKNRFLTIDLVKTILSYMQERFTLTNVISKIVVTLASMQGSEL